jgi:hypothetical protein
MVHPLVGRFIKEIILEDISYTTTFTVIRFS